MRRKAWFGGALAALAGAAIVGVLVHSQPQPPVSDDPTAMAPLVRVLELHRSEGARPGPTFVVYSNPPAIKLIYGPDLDESSFRARLNGADITPLFKPVPGAFDRIVLGDKLPVGISELVFVLGRVEDGETEPRVQQYRVTVERAQYAGVTPSAGSGATPSLPPLTPGVSQEEYHSGRSFHQQPSL